jgi:uncharacterized protein (TIGR02646 family)
MIKIDRTGVTKPDVLTKSENKSSNETERSIAFHSAPNYDGKKSFDFSEYRKPEIKEALRKLSSEKCAYCESTFLHTYPGDVEHFRPKGEITEAGPNQKPGYYWLASDWDNLLFSCRNCNQQLSHNMFGENGKIKKGKMNQFPLSDSSKYVRQHDNANGIEDEEPYRLLLNPYKDNPENHLEYGAEGTIRAKKDAEGNESPKGKTSIDVYVLQRVELVKCREKHLISIQAQIERVSEALENFNDEVKNQNDVKIKKFESVLNRELDCLRNFLKKNEPYLGLTRQIVGDFLKKNFNINI